MQIEQKRYSIKHTFSFKDEKLNFAYNDSSGSGDFDVPYADISMKKSVKIQSNEWLRNVGFLWVILGVFFVLMGSRSVIWIPIGLVCLLWHYCTIVRYTILQANRGELWIIQGKKHDQILQEIEKRRKDQILSLYGEIDFDNDPYQEIRKFKWLAEEDLITQDEADEKIAEIEMNSDIQSFDSHKNRFN